jgi:two-component system response regulator AtoC
MIDLKSPDKIKVVIAASNQDLWQLVEAERFRTDLYYRLNVIPLNIPPLRERLDDLPDLISHFIAKYSPTRLEVPPPFLRRLLAHNWPGNVRESENLIQRAVVLSTGKTLMTDGLDINQPSQLSQAKSLAEIEKRAILQALERHNYNQTQTARELEIPRHVLLYRMKKLGISAKES